MSATTTPSGEATLRPEIDPSSVTPGLEGFLATLFVVVLVIFLIRDMVKRIRRVRYAGEVEQTRVQQQSGTPDGPAADPDDAQPGEPGTRPGGKHGPGRR